MSVVVDGIELEPPRLLTASEVHTLAEYNARKMRGLTHTLDHVAAMQVLQLRFNWLGWTDTEGGMHPGNQAIPAYTQSPARRRRRWGLW